MAVDRPLKTDEKELLRANPRFQQQCIWAVRDFASYWADDSSSAQIATAGATRWAKNWVWCNRIVANPMSLEGGTTLYVDFLVLAKGMHLVDSALDFDVNTVIDYMVANGKFDELASLYVVSKTPTPLGF